MSRQIDQVIKPIRENVLISEQDLEEEKVNNIFLDNIRLLFCFCLLLFFMLNADIVIYRVII